MRIALDARPLRTSTGSGLAVLLDSLLTGLSSIDHENEYLLYTHAALDWPVPAGLRATKRAARGEKGTVWLQTTVPRWVRQDRVDVFWGTQHLLPLALPGRLPAVLSCHDLAHLRIPETMRSLNLWINRLLIPPSVRRANSIVALSEATAEELRDLLGASAANMRVIHPGLAEDFRPMDAADARRTLGSHLPGPDPYILCVGALEPKKNLATSLRAFARIVDRCPHRLYVAGPSGWKVREALELAESPTLHDRVTRLGYVPRPVLPALYAAADLFLFPSIYEGFGLPVVEAMACGTPVITSTVSSLPEAAGGAAELVDPLDDRVLAERIELVLGDAALRESMRQRGLERTATLSWETAARAYVDAFASVQ